MATDIVMVGTLGGAQTNSNIRKNGIQSQLTLGTDPFTLHLAKISKGQLIEVLTELKVSRLLTNFIFLGPFSINFRIRLLMILRYGVQLENGPFNRHTTDFMWMMIFGSSILLVLTIIPLFESFFMGVSLMFMLFYVWSREFPTANINIDGLVQLKVCLFCMVFICLLTNLCIRKINPL